MGYTNAIRCAERFCVSLPAPDVYCLDELLHREAEKVKTLTPADNECSTAREFVLYRSSDDLVALSKLNPHSSPFVLMSGSVGLLYARCSVGNCVELDVCQRLLGSLQGSEIKELNGGRSLRSLVDERSTGNVVSVGNRMTAKFDLRRRLSSSKTFCCRVNRLGNKEKDIDYDADSRNGI